jgi:NADPH-dependent 2,4-dienoyl-CoA reductase/sulfur reductase-like enzyme
MMQRKSKRRLSREKKAVIIGSGYIGVELADALRTKDLEVCLLEARDRIMPGIFDREISEKIKDYINDEGVEIITNALIESIKDKTIKIKDRNIVFDRLFVCAGLEPNIKLALEAGLKCDKGIKVDERGLTSDKYVYACGDSVLSIQSFDKKKIFSRLATTAVRQAAVIAENIAGANKKNEFVTGASVSKFGNLLFGSCGVNADYCLQNKIKIVFAVYNGQTKSEYYPGAQDVYIKLLASEKGKIVGCQIAGFEDVAGRINLISLAIKKEMSLEEFVNIETCYNPAVAPIFDPLVLAAQICLKKINARQE